MRCFLLGLSVILSPESIVLSRVVTLGSVPAATGLILASVAGSSMLEREAVAVGSVSDTISARGILWRMIAEYFSALLDARLVLIFFTKHVMTLLLMASSMTL